MAHKEPSMTILPYYTYPCIDTRVVGFTRADHLEACRLAAKAKGLASARNSPFFPPLLLFSFRQSSVNIPWAEAGTTDGDYLHAFQQIVMPIATEFAPELVISE